VHDIVMSGGRLTGRALRLWQGSGAKAVNESEAEESNFGRSLKVVSGSYAESG
jgi:hypothetical protein